MITGFQRRMGLNGSKMSPINHNWHVTRKRVNKLLEKAAKKPLVVVCAAAGCGKTIAVYDFVRETKTPTAWMQLSEYDNAPSRFFESYIHAAENVYDNVFIERLKDLGFPDTDEKINLFIKLRSEYLNTHPDLNYLIVMDDFHLITNPEVLRFAQLRMKSTENQFSTILICRSWPNINLADLQNSGDIFVIQDDDLNFTENELSQYLNNQGLSLEAPVLSEIYQDTHGWAFSVNLVAQLLRKSTGYTGYTQHALKRSIFQQMDDKVWAACSDALKHFLLRLSLIEHLPMELIDTLADGDADLLDEFKQQNAYIRYDVNMNAYLIHHLFLDFLREKKDLLTEDETQTTYRAAADWCRKNGFTVDALGYYEQVRDYDSMVRILKAIPLYLPYDLALYLKDVFARAPKEAFSQVDYLAVMHLRTVFCLGQEQDFVALARQYEHAFLEMPNSAFQQRNLGLIYATWGIMEMLASVKNGTYDYDQHFIKMGACFENAPIKAEPWLATNLGPWVSIFSLSSKEDMERCVDAYTRMILIFNRCLGILIGLADLRAGELKFYQGDLKEAQVLIFSAMEQAREARQFETVQRALIYLMRIAFAQGKYDEARQALNDINALREMKEYPRRFVDYEIALGWYFYTLRQPEQIPSWLKEKFSPYAHPFFTENIGNQIKARFYYLSKNYAPLFSYARNIKDQGTILFARVEMLSMEACARYQMRDIAGAFATLQEVYEAASPNEIIMPFIELGKDMRTLTLAALREPDCSIPREWLKMVNTKSHSYARYQAAAVARYEADNGSEMTALSPRETQVLHDLCDGLSRSEIAEKRGLSINTVKRHVSTIYLKLGVNNVVEAVRVALARKLV